MKDNLRQQLDLLEAQLVRAENKKVESVGRLARTKHLLERLEKTGKLGKDVHQLRREIERTEFEIVQRKRFHAEQVVKRFVKQFKKVEPLRIAKRQKNAESEAKSATLTQEIELIKTLDAESVASEIVSRAVTKKFHAQDVLGTSFAKRPLTTVESNVFARISKSQAVRDAISQFMEGASEFFTPIDGSLPVAPSTPSATHKDAQLKETGSSGSTESIIADDFAQFAVEPDTKSQTEPGAEEQAGDEVDPFFEEDLIIANDAEDAADNGFDEDGLPLLTQGYISGSEEEDDFVDVDPQPARKNRRGQRARRKIWEQKFGTRANHVIKAEKERKLKQEQKELKRKRTEEKMQAAKQRRREFESKPVHPSWEARMKQKEALEKAKFQGKKVTFN